MRSVGTSDVEITSGALHQDDKAFQALQLHFGSLSCVDVMESSGSYSTFEFRRSRDAASVISMKPLPEMMMTMIVPMLRVCVTRSTII